MAENDWMKDYTNIHGGLEAWKDHIARSNNSEQARAGLQRAGELFAQKFKEVVGRDPTRDEAGNYFKDVLKGDAVSLVDRPNDLRPVLNNYIVEQYGTTAEKEKEGQLETKSQGSMDTVGKVFKETLGRDPSEQEKSHFAKLMAETDADEYELGQALQMLPEYQETQDTSARDKLRGELTTSDQRFFNESVMPSIQSRFAQQGRTVDSSGFASALANAAKDVSGQRETYLAGLGREDYVNRRQQAITGYLGTLEQQQANANYNRARTDQLSDAYRSRAYDLTDYDRQAKAYQDYLASYGTKKKSSGGLFGGAGSLLGMGLGAAFAAPTGGMSLLAGSTLGGAAGSTAGGMFDY